MPELSLDKTPQEQYAPLDPAGFSGRIGRMRLLAWSMVISLIAMVTSILVLLAVKVSPTLGITCGAVLTLAWFIVSLRICAQRLHDLNWSAWMLLLHLVPVANLVLTLMMLLMPGTPGPNKYGPPPRPPLHSNQHTSIHPFHTKQHSTRAMGMHSLPFPLL